MTQETTTSTETVLDMLETFINQTPGFKLANYDSMRSYRQDYRKSLADKHDALTLLQWVCGSQMDLDTLKGGFRAFSGRLTLRICEHGDNAKVECGKNAKHTWCEDCDPAPSALCHWCNGRGYSDAKPGVMKLDYCTGQYFPTEYRAAACAVLASALWDYYRDDFSQGEENKGNAIRSQFRKLFGKRIQQRWFD